MVYCWALLQGLCGLRQLEAAFIREGDLNLTVRTLRIAPSSAHRPKTRSSHRTIPLPPVIAEALANWIRGLKVRHTAEGFLFFSIRTMTGRARAKSAEARSGAFTQDTIGHRWAKGLQRARAERVDLAGEICPTSS